MMKKVTLTLALLIALASATHAQIKKGDVLLNLSGNYDENHNYNGVAVSNLSEYSKTLNGGLSAGLAVSNSLVIGAGLEYGRIKNNQTYYSLLDINNSIYTTYNQSKTTTSVIAPMLYAKYLKKAISRIYVGGHFEANYGFAKSESEFGTSTMAWEKSFSTFSSAPVTTVSGGNADNSTQLLNLMIQPEITCFLTKKLGLSLKAGGVRYTSTNNNIHEWHISLNPSSWEYGLFWKFRK